MSSNWKKLLASQGGGGGKKKGGKSGGQASKKKSSSSSSSSSTKKKKKLLSKKSKLGSSTAAAASATATATPSPLAVRGQWDSLLEDSGLPPPFAVADGRLFLSPGDSDFGACAAQCYDKLVVDGPDILADRVHTEVRDALETMRTRGMFHYDVVSAGSSVSRTFVKRLLVGNAGMTYHYQRLRLFAFPWEEARTDAGDPMRMMHTLNVALERRAREHINTRLRAQRAREGEGEGEGKGEGGGEGTGTGRGAGQGQGQGQGAAPVRGTRLNPNGSCSYNISLINYMEPDGEGDVPLRQEPIFGLGTTSVSWHADSSLQDFSTIGVYHQYIHSSSAAAAGQLAAGSGSSGNGSSGAAAHAVATGGAPSSFDKGIQVLAERDGIFVPGKIAGPSKTEGQWKVKFDADGKVFGREPGRIKRVRGGDSSSSSSSSSSSGSGGSKKGEIPEQWRVAVRVVGDDVTPALSTPLADRETYFMLDDFNHKHHHAVLTGRAGRYSSTHRVSVVEKDTIDYIRRRCDEGRAAAARAMRLEEDAMCLLGSVHTELEMEWIRMFYVQGERHMKMHKGYVLRCWWDGV